MNTFDEARVSYTMIDVVCYINGEELVSHLKAAVANGVDEVRNCVNPKHLTEQTQSANVRQYTDKRVACPKGHPYDEENTYIRKNGARKCRACHADAMRQRRGQ